MENRFIPVVPLIKIVKVLEIIIKNYTNAAMKSNAASDILQLLKHKNNNISLVQQGQNQTLHYSLMAFIIELVCHLTI